MATADDFIKLRINADHLVYLAYLQGAIENGNIDKCYEYIVELERLLIDTTSLREIVTQAFAEQDREMVEAEQERQERSREIVQESWFMSPADITRELS